MASEKELKEMIVDLKVENMKLKVPDGHCPLAYYNHPTTKQTDINCNDIDCKTCESRLYEGWRQLIQKQVAEL